MKNIVIGCATPHDNKTFWEKAPLAKFLFKHHADPTIDHRIVYNNKAGLSYVYNELIRQIDDKKILLFVHDDVSIEDAFLHEKLNKALEHYDIVGLAGGSSKVEIKSPAAWHLMTDLKSQSGMVAHSFPEGIFTSNYGYTPKRCLLVDGLFIAVNLEKIKQKGLWWDPQFAFHHYDLQFCIDANGLGLTIGTWPIWVIHYGLGDSILSPEWKESEKRFLETNR